MSRVLGIDFGGTKVAVGVSDSDGPTLSERILLETGGHTLPRTLAAAREILGSPAAVGVSTCGVIRDGRVRLAPNLPGWDGLELPRLLREEFGAVPVLIDNDVNAAAAAELRWGALRGVSTGLYVNLGTGLAAALVVGGRVVPGAHGAAGEIGYLLGSPDEPGFAEGRAPLEERVSGVALAARGSALLGRQVTAADLLDLAGSPARDVVDEALDVLAMTVANLCVILDPERVVVGGGMMGRAERILPRLSAAVARAAPFPPEIGPARFVHDAPLLGALALAYTASGARTAPE
ncbi:ROK family protein [Streptosporangium roseum]|uniref:ROK family protein n=1 Tax=Streptosporangium roseum TaxID=2001 RepID=UPI0004CC9AA0|nr:ROK family protein [Streptosporangium roseum]